MAFIRPAACIPLHMDAFHIWHVSIHIPIYTLLWEAYVISTSHFASAYTWEIFLGHNLLSFRAQANYQ